jgi:hypothetical protein
MQGTAALIFGGVMLLVFLGLAAVMLLQEARFDPSSQAPEYILNDAVAFVGDRIDPEVRRRIGRSGVQRVLGWQVHLLQQLARRDKDAPIVLGNADGTAQHIADQLKAEGHVFSLRDIGACLELQGSYMVSVGAVGQEAEGIAGTMPVQKEVGSFGQDQTT